MFSIKYQNFVIVMYIITKIQKEMLNGLINSDFFTCLFTRISNKSDEKTTINVFKLIEINK